MAATEGKPAWAAPADTAPKLLLYNSITRRKELFVPRNGRHVKWYSCGPTVYDHSHMGHARSYITFDILRRVLQSYFNYNIEFVMNITDLDDKIIIRARRNYLFEKYVASKPSADTVLADAATALKRLEAKIGGLAESEADKRDMLKKNLAAGTAAHTAAVQSKDVKDVLATCRDALAELIDSREGASVSDPSLFTTLTQKFEESFFNDMKQLNVLPPDVLTRVTEYVDEIVAFVKKIIENGFAYESCGSVYFDTVKYRASDKHKYLKLVPEALGDSVLLAEGEGELFSSEAEKRNPCDFALWKASKPGEPAWPSPWGKGRPGWHIECSAMCSEAFGSLIDIHTGGVDLKFPHHDNEIAQSEAYYDCDDWCRFFLHSGHLNIEGRKMSKSLKNFITIKDALAKFSARQLRFAFLLHQWHATLDYSDETMTQAVQREKAFNEFFLNIKAALRTLGSAVDKFPKFGKAEMTLNRYLRQAKNAVHAALSDNVDTVATLLALQELMATTNVYLRDAETEKRPPHGMLLQQVAAYITQILDAMGVLPDATDIGFPLGGTTQALEDVVVPKLQAFAETREVIRRLAREMKNSALLAECDRVRDVALPDVGVRLEDKETGPVVKLVDREELKREKQREEEMKAAKKREKEEQARKRAEQEAAKLAQSRIPPSEMFKGRKEYSKLDAQGIPTHDEKGEELSKSSRKKLEKEYKAQEKLYNDAKAASGAT